MAILSHTSFQTHLQKFLRLNGKLHRELIHDLFGVAVDDESDRVFEGDTSLLAVEELILVDLGGCCLVFYRGCRIGDDHVRKSVRTAFITQEERVTLAVITRIFGMNTHLDESAVGVLAMSRRDTFGYNPRAGVLTDMNHLRSRIRRNYRFRPSRFCLRDTSSGRSNT